MITSEERTESRQGIDTLLTLFSEHSTRMVTDRLSDNTVSIAPSTHVAKQKLNLSVNQARTECVPLGCTHNLWIRASVFDHEFKRTVWTGYFKVGAPFAKKSDQKAIDSFADSLLEELKDSDLL